MNIAVLVSGGVDSSVALALLKEQGHSLTAFYLKIWLEDEVSYLGDCPWQEDLDYAQKVCDQLSVPLQVVSLQREYWDNVVAYTVSQARAGFTPNPDMLCNSRIKFGMFWDKVHAGFDYVATGHYAQVNHTQGYSYLNQAPDPIKDQSYFLSQLSQSQLKRALFPIGHLAKTQVRELAHHYNLATKDRKDSQGICFLGKLKFKDFLKHYLGENAGDMVEIETNKKLGDHEGLWFYTIGQRQGLGLPGGPWFVVAKDKDRNILFLSKNYYSDDKLRNQFEISDINWIGDPLVQPTAMQIKMRHGPHKHTALLVPNGDSGTAKITLSERDQGIAPGQFAVLYQDERCLGGGVISRTW